MLHVTNGTSVSLASAGVGGEVLAWLDVLHEGPVPDGLDAVELRRVRGIFLDAELPGDTPAELELARRDATLSAYEEITLWFEHDLFDQLQLIQILDRVQGSATQVGLICTDRYLGPMSSTELASLWPARHTVSESEFDLAEAAWHAFRAPDPVAIEALLARDTSALPFLAGALRRHLQQFPAVASGLARTERQILQASLQGRHTLASLFAADQRMEERIFMGDASLRRWVSGLAECRHPLLAVEGGVYRVTSLGREALAGSVDHVRLNGINRWLGGVHLIGNDVLWRWDEGAGRLCRK
ncbi:MAG TPA: hypothetical protein VMH28_15915 [Candidatus Acidoferrales bacterium]|nr:hypothetical protein [Candidatus Acidoferrales bacterium]